MRSILGSERDKDRDFEKNPEQDSEEDNDIHASLYQESLAMHRRLGGVLEDCK